MNLFKYYLRNVWSIETDQQSFKIEKERVLHDWQLVIDENYLRWKRKDGYKLM